MVVDMNKNFFSVISASKEDRKGLFLATANRLGTPVQNVEKDFWVCWVVDLLFNGKEKDEPRLLFKGGTSLSKAYGLISRFSEDLDITIFREDMGQNIEVSDMEQLSGKQQRIRLENIRQASQIFIQNTLKTRLNNQMNAIFEKACISTRDPVVPDENDPTQQTLMVHYPSVSIGEDDYIKPAVKIEGGAKSALDPHQSVTIEPYMAKEMPDTLFTIQNVTTIDAERTFWDKIIILHGLRRWHDNRKELRQQGHRISRHYYDTFKLLRSKTVKKINYNLALDCAKHAQIFFNSSDLDLKNARPGFFALLPSIEMQKTLKRDYLAMSGMIFGDIPLFEEVLEEISQFQDVINAE